MALPADADDDNGALRAVNPSLPSFVDDALSSPARDGGAEESKAPGFVPRRDEARRELERSGPVQARHSRSARAATRTLPPVSGARRGVSSAPTIRWPAVRRSI